MPRLRFTTFDSAVHTHELKLGKTLVGRTPDNDLQIDDLAISSHHVEIRYDGESVTVRDLDSVGGTYVDGQPVSEAAVQVGQIISLGAFLIRLDDSTRELRQAADEPLQPVQLPDGSYSCLRHPAKRALYECEACFDLACEECARVRVTGESKAACCKLCGALSREIDWRGLEMTTAGALKDLFVPKRVKQALEFWDKHKNKLNFRAAPQGREGKDRS